MHRGSRGSLTSSRYGYGPRTKGAHSADGTPPRGSQQGTSNSPSASPTMAGNDENNQCPKCDDPSTNQMIECSICFKWIHAKCENLAKALFDAMVKDEVMPYVCRDCTPLLGNTAVAKFARTLGNNVQVLEVEQKKTNDRVSTLESNHNFKNKSEFEEAVCEIIEEKAIEIKLDMHEMFLRRKKAVIAGASDTTDDDQLIRDLLEEMGVSELKVRKHFRLKAIPSSNRPPLLNVEFHNEYEKYKFISKECRDKLDSLPDSNKFHGFQVFPDRTYKERKEHKRLKDLAEAKNRVLRSQGQLQEKWIVRGMKLSKIKIQQTQD